jgi:Ecdysteroid kinase-like family
MMPPMDPSVPIEESPFYNSFMKMFHGFTDAIRNYGGFEVYADKIACWDKIKIMTQYVDVAEPMRCGFQVLNHGDTWLNNMMFKSDGDNNPIDLKLIDYQMPFWASPAADILYFLISSVADDIKVDHFDDFIEFYQGELASALKKLNYDQHIPTLPEMHIDLIDKGFFGKLKLFPNYNLMKCSRFSFS